MPERFSFLLKLHTFSPPIRADKWDDRAGSSLPLIGPILRIGGQPRSYGIHPDVIRFLDAGFPCPQTMIEKIPLPADAVLFRKPGFEASDRISHGHGAGKAHQCVKMIRHGQRETALQDMSRFAECQRFIDGLPYCWIGKLVHAAFNTAYRDEIDLALGICRI